MALTAAQRVFATKQQPTWHNARKEPGGRGNVGKSSLEATMTNVEEEITAVKGAIEETKILIKKSMSNQAEMYRLTVEIRKLHTKLAELEKRKPRF